MKKILKYFLFATVVLTVVVSCTKVEKVQPVEYNHYVDSYDYSENEVIFLECTVDSFLEGESMVHVWIRNIAWSRVDQEVILEVEMDSYLTTNDFQRELRSVERKERSGLTIQFCTKYRGLEISWAMFDEIYKTYYTWKR